MARELLPGLYGYRDLEVGDWFETGEAIVDAAKIDAFAEVSGDFYEIHMDAAFARNLGYRDRVAHGLLILSTTDGLKNQADAKLRGIVSLGWDWSFDGPVIIGDTIRVRVEVAAMRLTSKGDRGIVNLGFTVTNQDGEKVQSGTNTLLTAL